MNENNTVMDAKTQMHIQAIKSRRAATDAALARANRTALLEHARMGRSVPEGTPDGKVIWITPKEIFARYGLDEFGREMNQ